MKIDFDSPASKKKIEEILTDFKEGCITVVYSREDKLRTMIYCAVEMLADWIERPTELDASEIFNVNGRDIEINVRRGVFSAHYCLGWLQNCASGQVNLFATSKDKKNGWDNKVKLLHTFGLKAPFEFPQFIFPYDSFWGEMPIYGRRPCGARWFQLRTENSVLPEIFESDENFAKVSPWIDNHLQMKFSDRKYLIGSCHLFLTNPVLKEITYSPTNDWQSLQIFLAPTPLTDLSTLTILVREDSVAGIKNRIVLTGDTLKNEMKIPLQSEVDAVGVEVLCSKRGLLYSSKPTPYIKSIGINMNVINKQRNIKIQDKGEIVEEYSVSVHGKPIRTNVGEPSDDRNTNIILSKEDSLIKKKNMAETLGQKWFDKDSENPKAEIRKILNIANRSIRIVDPYFGGTEIYSFSASLSNSIIPIQVLTSREYLNKDDNTKKLVEALAKIRKLDTQMNSIEIRVMSGNKPDIHDRFFAIDSEVWIIGTSLNEFGSRGTVILKAPYPEPISLKIKSVWDKSQSLEDYLDYRALNAKPAKAKKRKSVKRKAVKK